MRPNPDATSSALHTRAIEAGARVVAVPAHGVSVVLQLPRGNLETISPRLLVLIGVATALGARDYATAWGMLTRHRVDLNLLVDFRYGGCGERIRAAGMSESDC